MRSDKTGIAFLVVLLVILGLGITTSVVIIEVAIHSDETEIINQPVTDNTGREIIIDVSKTQDRPYEVKPGDTLVLTGLDFNPRETNPVVQFVGADFNLAGSTTPLVGTTENSPPAIVPEGTRTEELPSPTNNQISYVPFILSPKSVTAEIVEVTDDSVKVRVPEGTQSGQIQVLVNKQVSCSACIMVNDNSREIISGSSGSLLAADPCRSSVYFVGFDHIKAYPEYPPRWPGVYPVFICGYVIGYLRTPYYQEGLLHGSPNVYIPYAQTIVNPLSTKWLTVSWRYSENDAPFYREPRPYVLIPPGGSIVLDAGWYCFFNADFTSIEHPPPSIYPFTICWSEVPPDTTPPSVQNITITPSITNANPTITATATDTASKITAAEFYGDWVSPVPSPGSATSMYAEDGNFDSLTETVKATINISSLSEGTYTVWVRAKDAAGNWTSPPVTATFTIDLTPPEVISITVTPPVAGDATGTAVIAGNLQIQIVFTETMNTSIAPTVTYDPTGIIGPQPCTLNGVWSTTTSTNDTYTVFNTNDITVDTGDGPATVTVTAAQDLAGNISITGTTTFVININPIRIQNVTATPSKFNPQFGETTTISYVLSEPAQNVTVTVVDDINNIITLYSGVGVAGINSFIWNASVGNFPFRAPPYRITFNASNPWETAVQRFTNINIRNIPVITDLSIIPYPFYTAGVWPRVEFMINVAINIQVRIEDALGNNQLLRDFIDTTGNSVLWDGTRDAVFGGGDSPDGLYGYIIEQTGPPPPPYANSKTGTIMLIRNNTASVVSPDNAVSVYYNPLTPGLGIINIQPVDPATLTDQVKAIVTADPGVYIQSNIYDIKALPSITFPAGYHPLLVFKYDPSITGDVSETLKLRYWDTTLPTPAWADVVPQYIDLANKQIIAEVSSLSLFALFTGADTTPPVITITSPEDGREYYSLTDGQPTVIPITYTAEDPIIEGITSGISYTWVTLNGQVYTEDTIDLSNLLGENILTVTAIDGSGNVARKSVRFTVVLPASLRLEPETLKVNPGVLTAFVKFPAGYEVANIIDATCDGAKYESMELSPDETTMVIKFRRKAIETALAEKGQVLDTQFEVRGTFRFNQKIYLFKGTDTIKKILPESVPPENK